MTKRFAEVARLLGADPKLATRAGNDWIAFADALVAGGLAYGFEFGYGDGDDDDEDRHDADEAASSASIVAGVQAITTRMTMSPSAFAWYVPAKYGRHVAPAILKVLADALSFEGVGIVRLTVGGRRRYVIALVRWADRTKVVAAAKAAGQGITTIGKHKPRTKPLAPAKPLPANAKRMHVKSAFMPVPNVDPARLVVTIYGGKRIDVLDLSTWPPGRSVLVPHHIGALAFQPDGGFAVVARPRTTPRTIIRVSATGVITELEAPDEEDFEITALGFLGKDVVIAFADHVYRRKKATRPFVYRAGKGECVPFAELPAATRDLRTGFARTGAGDDVVLWSGGGYVRAGKQLARRFELPKGSLGNTAPAEGAAFFSLSNEAIFEVRAGKPPAKRLRAIENVEALAPGPDGAILLRIRRDEKAQPILVAWWPEQRTYAKVGATMLGYHKGDASLDDHGYAATSNLVWTYETTDEDLRAIAWGDIAALPRESE